MAHGLGDSPRLVQEGRSTSALPLSPRPGSLHRETLEKQRGASHAGGIQGLCTLCLLLETFGSPSPPSLSQPLLSGNLRSRDLVQVQVLQPKAHHPEV